MKAAAESTQWRGRECYVRPDPVPRYLSLGPAYVMLVQSNTTPLTSRGPLTLRISHSILDPSHKKLPVYVPHLSPAFNTFS